ncbi:nuclease [Rhynchospora pubera]|uniref:Nuclease n=1 Tax=Rhynchospora pubera TaxID=906938 RepID=A0AAV8GDJ9_9POAL|nr:nuclease [Rhynchospora pubera]
MRSSKALEKRRLRILIHHMHLMALVQVYCLLVYWLMLELSTDYPSRKERKEREVVRRNLLYQILTSPRTREVIRMGPRAFLDLCKKLETEGGLRPTRQASIEEQVAKFLYILGHNVRNRPICFFFRRSGETNCRHFHKVLKSVIMLGGSYFHQPDGSRIPVQVSSNRKYFPYFKDCLGAIDGTHIRAKVSPLDAPRYRGRKEYPTQNVLAACTFDLKFTYVLPGWEGTASDSKIIKSALNRPCPLIIPEGKYYLVDAGFMTKSSLLTPYRATRYHLKEYSRNPPRNPRELYNLRHSSLRNAIERAFGVLKKRFPIIGSSNQSYYSVEVQKKIIMACCVLHNYLIERDPDRRLMAQVDAEVANRSDEQRDTNAVEDPQEITRGDQLRDEIAAAMWRDYNNNRV